MKPTFCAIGALVLCVWVGPDGWAHESPLTVGRAQEIGVHWAMPAGLSQPAQRQLNEVSAALDRKQSDIAAAKWKAFLKDRAESFDPNTSIDYMLNRLAAARNKSANEACRKLRFYDAQENAIFEHISTVDKQLSAYGGNDITAVPLREPQLAEYGDDAEAVTLAPGASVGAKELQSSLDRWKARLPEISEAREAALNAFVKAVQEDAALVRELQRVELDLRKSVSQ